MRREPGFLSFALAGFVLSAGGAVLFTVLAPLLGNVAVLRGVLALVALGAALHLIAVSRERAGRVLVVLVWLLATALLWALAPPLGAYALALVGGLWLVRVLYHHPGPLAALLDLALGGLAYAAGLWATAQTGSLFLALWCFFLVQALFVLIPFTFARPDPVAAESDFDRASRSAEAALKKLSSIH
ncbi:MAG: hypothetical protein R3202_02965 [Candidatus Competibacterales bacterium]|nr:hypothetical protein [Candidatus Competibacterales bacterium]